MSRSRAAFLIAALAALTGLPTPGHAQTFGVVAGPADARQIQPREEDSGSHSGFLVGAWADVAAPAGWVSVTAEAVFVRRGATYALEGGLEGQIDVDYLSFAVLPTANLRVGPLALLLYAGASVENHVHSSAALELQAPFRDANGQVFSVLAGAGLAFHRGRATFRLEARLSEQLTSAFSGAARDVRHRTTEFVFRLGMRPEA